MLSVDVQAAFQVPSPLASRGLPRELQSHRFRAIDRAMRSLIQSFLSGRSLPISDAQRHDSVVNCATALRRYLPEVLRVQIGLSGS